MHVFIWHGRKKWVWTSMNYFTEAPVWLGFYSVSRPKCCCCCFLIKLSDVMVYEQNVNGQQANLYSVRRDPDPARCEFAAQTLDHVFTSCLLRRCSFMTWHTNPQTAQHSWLWFTRTQKPRGSCTCAQITCSPHTHAHACTCAHTHTHIQLTIWLLFFFSLFWASN